MGLVALVFYGVGDILGAGIYALIGKMAGVMGNAIWVAFLLSLLAAVLTGLSYASLGSRYPRAAGAAYVAQRAFGRPFVSHLVGLAVVASGLTSMAAQSHAFSGYLLGLLGRAPPSVGAEPPVEPALAMPEASLAAWIAIILIFIAALTFINFWGIRQASWLNILFTSVEALGLFIVIAVGARYWGSVDYLEVPPSASGGTGELTAALVFQGAVLTFYAFIGFEDMINVTEEVKDPRHNYPIAVVLALAITGAIYLAVSITAVSVVPYPILNASGEPLVTVVTAAEPGFPRGVFSFIALFSITNTALLNYIMGSRVIYGMARDGLLPRPLGAVHPVQRTPHRAILALMVVVTVLAISGEIRTLASATSVLLLGVFIVANASLLVLKRRPAEPRGAFEIPSAVPLGGILVSAAMLWHAEPAALRTAAWLVAGIAALYLVNRLRR